MFFYCPSFCCEDNINLFIQLMNFNYISSNFSILSFDKIFSTLDLLYLLQNTPTKRRIISQSFFPKRYNILPKNYNKIDEQYYNRLYLSLLMHNEKFFFVKNAYHTFHNYTIFNIQNWNSEYKPILLQYIHHKYNLPLLEDNETSRDVEKDITFLRTNHIFVDDVYKSISHNQDIPIGADISKYNISYVNQEFIENHQLQISSFFDPIDNYCFHHSFLGENVKTGMNPFTRRPFDAIVLDEWISEFKGNNTRHNFPISTIKDSISHFPYIFDSIYLDQTNYNYKVKSLIDYIEKFFFINHPYNNIYRLYKMKAYEIAYISYILHKDTSLFPLFQKVIETPTILNLLKTILFYCKNKYKYINVIYFFLEEILADLSSFEKIEKFLPSISSNTYEIMINYTIRYNTSNIIFFNKFLGNMLKINEYKEKYTS